MRIPRIRKKDAQRKVILGSCEMTSAALSRLAASIAPQHDRTAARFGLLIFRSSQFSGLAV
jgi:hypothetical protein